MAVWFLSVVLFLPLTNDTPKKVVVIPLRGTVDRIMFFSLKRRLEKAKKYNPDVVVLDIDTYGGYVIEAERIVALLEREWQFDIAAYVGVKALSAGAYISLACRWIAMSKTATLGDCMPILPFGTMSSDVAEKARSPLRAKFAALARRNGYPEALALSMVDPTIEVRKVVLRQNGKQTIIYVTKKDYDKVVGPLVQAGAGIISDFVVVPSGKLLTMDGEKAKEYGFVRFLAPNLETMLTLINAKKPVITLNKSWWEHLITFFNWGPVVALLLVIAGICVYIEVTHPGMIIPGAVGVGCLAFVFLSSYLAGLAAIIEILMIIAGLILLVVEIFLTPGFGVSGIVGALLLFVGGFLLFQPFVIPQSPWEMEVLKRNIVLLGSAVVGMAVGVFLLSQYLPKAQAFENIFVTRPPEDMSGAAAVEEKTVGVSVGDEGVTITPLRPSGKAYFRGKPVSVVTEGDFLSEGEKVVVVEVSGNRIVVRKKA